MQVGEALKLIFELEMPKRGAAKMPKRHRMLQKKKKKKMMMILSILLQNVA